MYICTLYIYIYTYIHIHIYIYIYTYNTYIYIYMDDTVATCCHILQHTIVIQKAIITNTCL